MELPQLNACTCILSALEEVSPIKGQNKGLGSLRSQTVKELTRHGDRITIASKRGGEVDPKCIMQLKRMLRFVPDDW